MPLSPPKKLEAAVAFFIPAASREHVLGDLHERCRSPWQYAREALRTVPMVVLGRMLRTARPEVVALEGAALCLVYWIAAWQAGAADLLRVVTAAMIGLAALLVRDAYCAADQGPRPVTALEGALLALLVQLSMAALGWGLAIPAKASGMACFLSAALIFAMRMMYPGQRTARPLTQSLAEVPGRALRFERMVRQRNLREYAGAVFVIGAFGFAAWKAADMQRIVPAVLFTLGASFLSLYLYKRGTPSSPPAPLSGLEHLRFYRAEVERQRGLLKTVWWWYLGPLMPGFVAILIGQLAAKPEEWPRHLLSSIPLVLLLWGVGWLNRREAEHLRREIESLNAIEKEAQ